MGITLILVMGMLAFIINVGLFVKAKINLQNAVDAAAFSGAATQSRQLTNIAYLNWEMRNTYKEWMFKYYVLGQLGLASEGGPPSKPYNLSNAKIATANRVDFLLRNTPVLGDDAASFFDRYNMPSICVHNNSSTNICPLYGLPGIPRFPAIGVAGISEIHEAFVNKLVDEKGENCSARSQINFLAAISWAYSSGIKDMAGAPLIATNRPGAWTQALELGMRMRNLEMIVNRPPISEPISVEVASALQGLGTNIGLNERPVKAYWSAMRNLGGGKYKDQLDPSAASTQGRDELAASFRLTEIAPQAFNAPPNSLSGFLIPQNNDALQKYYLDLQAVTVNYATLFTTFATTGNDFSSTVKSEATCIVSKSAIPVPGYLMGFVKNPAVLTYYAVKGEADFTGLFFPKTSEDQPSSFKLTAYAAAKPFGGRIGPRLFKIEGNQEIRAREDEERKTTPYIAGLDMTFAAGGSFKPGMPIPSSASFWANSLPVLGGTPEASTDVGFGIPNMLYDYESDGELSSHGLAGGQPIMVIKQALSAETPGVNDTKGLYSGFQFRSLKKALGTASPGSAMTSDQVVMAIVRARRVTKYDVANYLVPDYRQVSGTSNVPPILNRRSAVEGDDSGKAFYYTIFAPLTGSGLLYESGEYAKTIAQGFRGVNANAIATYLKSLKDVADAIFALPSQGGSSVNAQAAQSIHINSGPRASETAFPPMTGDDLTNADNCPKDMASKFNHFFNQSYTACGIVPLELLISEYIEKQTQGSGSMYYTSTYYNDLPPETVMTAYQPGIRQGVQEGSADAIAAHPLNLSTPGIATYSTRRNFYSTKFVQLAKLMEGISGGSSAADYLRESPLRESDTKSPDDLLSIGLQNPINAVTSGMNNPYFLDF